MESSASASVPKTVTIPLRTQGSTLPFGVLDPTTGAINKNLNVRRWRMAEERRLGELRDNDQSNTASQFVSGVLSTMCVQFGPHNFTQMEEPKRKLVISQAYLGDVFYAYLWLRVQALGPHLHLNVTCPRCRYKHPFVADLETTPITTVADPKQATWHYELLEPFQIRNQDVKMLTLGQARWHSLERLSNGSGLNTGAAKASIIAGSVVNIPNWKTSEGEIESVVLVDTELDDMGKRDIERLTQLIDERSLGPDMSIQSNCPRCKYEFKTALDWGYDSFFGSSSR